MERFVARNSPLRLGGLVAGALAFVAVGLWMVGAFGPPPDPGAVWIGWASILFFGAMFPIGAMRLFDRSDQIVIDAEGLTYRAWSDDHIPWDEVAGIEEARIERQTMFAIHLHDPDRHPPQRMLGKVARGTGNMGYGHMALTATGTDRNAGELRDALLRFAPEHLLRG